MVEILVMVSMVNVVRVISDYVIGVVLLWWCFVVSCRVL